MARSSTACWTWCARSLPPAWKSAARWACSPPNQARQLQEAGLHAYNHNLDTGENDYPEIVSTRTYRDRIETLGHVGRAGISVCCGGILGMGESDEDRIDLLCTLLQLPTPPESIPVNALVPIAGTPLGDREKTTVWELVRMIACARILFPTAMVRLSAGRDQLSAVEQALCFLAGANSIFSGDPPVDDSPTPAPTPTKPSSTCST